MAQLSISIAELAELLAANKLLHHYITDFHMEGDYISFNFHTGQFFPKYIPVSLLFLSYSAGQLVLDISTNWMSDKFMKLLPVKNNDYINLKFPKLIVKLHKFTTKYLNGILIEAVSFQNGAFKIKFTTRREVADQSENIKKPNTEE
jgi:hypothetical protein